MGLTFETHVLEWRLPRFEKSSSYHTRESNYFIKNNKDIILMGRIATTVRFEATILLFLVWFRDAKNQCLFPPYVFPLTYLFKRNIH